MASPASSSDKITSVLTAVYKDELRKLDHPRESLTSVTKVALTDEAFILYTPNGPNFRALTREQSNHIRALEAANIVPELDEFVHGLMQNALKLPAHMQHAFLAGTGPVASINNQVDFNVFFKDKIFKEGKCLQVVKVMEGDKLTIVFQLDPTKGGGRDSIGDVTKRVSGCYDTAHKMFVGAELSIEGDKSPVMKPTKSSDDPLTNALFDAHVKVFLRKGSDSAEEKQALADHAALASKLKVIQKRIDDTQRSL